MFESDASGIYLNASGLSPFQFYVMTFLIGAGVGYWALFVTVASEQFGTDIRSTAANTVPNFVRGAVVPITLSFAALSPRWTVPGAAAIVGGVCLALAFAALAYLKESFGKDLDYLEG